MEQPTKLQMAYEIKTYCPTVSIVCLLLMSKPAVKELLTAIAKGYIADATKTINKQQTKH